MDTPHFQQVTVEMDPFRDDNPVGMVKRYFQALHPEARAILTIRGYINSENIQMTEAEMVARIQETTRGKCVEEHYEFRDISAILENDLFRRFTNKAREAGYTGEEAKQLQDIAIRAMMKAEL